MVPSNLPIYSFSSLAPSLYSKLSIFESGKPSNVFKISSPSPSEEPTQVLFDDTTIPTLVNDGRNISFESLIAISNLTTDIKTLNLNCRMAMDSTVDIVLLLPLGSTSYVQDSLLLPRKYRQNQLQSISSSSLACHVTTTFSLAIFPSYIHDPWSLFHQLRSNLTQSVADGRFITEFRRQLLLRGENLGKIVTIMFGNVTSVNLHILDPPVNSPVSAPTTTVYADIHSNSSTETSPIMFLLMAGIGGGAAMIVILLFTAIYKYVRIQRSKKKRTAEILSRAEDNEKKTSPSFRKKWFSTPTQSHPLSGKLNDKSPSTLLYDYFGMSWMHSNEASKPEISPDKAPNIYDAKNDNMLRRFQSWMKNKSSSPLTKSNSTCLSEDFDYIDTSIPDRVNDSLDSVTDTNLLGRWSTRPVNKSEASRVHTVKVQPQDFTKKTNHSHDGSNSFFVGRSYYHKSIYKIPSSARMNSYDLDLGCENDTNSIGGAALQVYTHRGAKVLSPTETGVASLSNENFYAHKSEYSFPYLTSESRNGADYNSSFTLSNADAPHVPGTEPLNDNFTNKRKPVGKLRNISQLGVVVEDSFSSRKDRVNISGGRPPLSPPKVAMYNHHSSYNINSPSRSMTFGSSSSFDEDFGYEDVFKLSKSDVIDGDVPQVYMNIMKEISPIAGQPVKSPKENSHVRNSGRTLTPLFLDFDQIDSKPVQGTALDQTFFDNVVNPSVSKTEYLEERESHASLSKSPIIQKDSVANEDSQSVVTNTVSVNTVVTKLNEDILQRASQRSRSSRSATPTKNLGFGRSIVKREVVSGGGTIQSPITSNSTKKFSLFSSLSTKTGKHREDTGGTPVTTNDAHNCKPDEESKGTMVVASDAMKRESQVSESTKGRALSGKNFVEGSRPLSSRHSNRDSIFSGLRKKPFSSLYKDFTYSRRSNEERTRDQINDINFGEDLGHAEIYNRSHPETVEEFSPVYNSKSSGTSETIDDATTLINKAASANASKPFFFSKRHTSKYKKFDNKLSVSLPPIVTTGNECGDSDKIVDDEIFTFVDTYTPNNFNDSFMGISTRKGVSKSRENNFLASKVSAGFSDGSSNASKGFRRSSALQGDSVEDFSYNVLNNSDIIGQHFLSIPRRLNTSNFDVGAQVQENNGPVGDVKASTGETVGRITEDRIKSSPTSRFFPYNAEVAFTHNTVLSRKFSEVFEISMPQQWRSGSPMRLPSSPLSRRNGKDNILNVESLYKDYPNLKWIEMPSELRAEINIKRSGDDDTDNKGDSQPET